MTVLAFNLLNAPAYVATAGDPLAIDKAHRNDIVAIAFSPDGKRVVSACHARQITAWESDTGKEAATNQEKNRFPTMFCLALTPDGGILASGSQGGNVALYSFDTLKLRERLPAHTEGGVGSLAVSPDGKVLASTGGKERVRFWDIAQGKEIATLKDSVPLATKVAYSPDGKTLAIATYADKTILLWDIAGSKVREKLEGHKGQITTLVFSPDGKWLASADQTSQAVILWDTALKKGPVVLELRRRMSYASSLGFTPDSKTLAITGMNAKAAHLWDIEKRQEMTTLEEPGRPSAGAVLAISHDGKRIATGSKDGRITIWDMPERK